MPSNRPPVSPAATQHVDATEDEGADIVIYPASVRGVPPGVQSAEAIPAGRFAGRPGTAGAGSSASPRLAIRPTRTSELLEGVGVVLQLDEES